MNQCQGKWGRTTNKKKSIESIEMNDTTLLASIDNLPAAAAHAAARVPALQPFLVAAATGERRIQQEEGVALVNALLTLILQREVRNG
jgi:hypothetical protein